MNATIVRPDNRHRLERHAGPRHATSRGTRARPPGRPRTGEALAGALLLLLAVSLIPAVSCRSTAAPDPHGGLTISLDAVPLLLKADSSATSTIWATVLEKGRPVQDSTRVSFVTTIGTVTPEAVTRDGLATATFTPSTDAGSAVVIAQVRAVRDTVMITVY